MFKERSNAVEMYQIPNPALDECVLPCELLRTDFPLN